MTAIAGYVAHGGPLPPSVGCSQILDVLARFGGDAKSIERLGDAAFGRDLRKVVPEDDFDCQPLLGSGGGCLFVADARIDNRDELTARFNLDNVRASRMSDGAMLLVAWDRLGLRCVDHLLGDYTFAVWEERERRLTLARSPLGFKPLFYTRNDRFTAFATMPDGLTTVVPAALNRGQAAAIAAGQPFRTDETMFSGVRRVLSGHAVVITPNGQTIRRLWDLDNVGPPPSSLAEAGERLRSELDRAVSAQLRRRGGRVAAQLSAGRDSSAVATTAARLLAAGGEQLIALTAAPRVGFREGENAAWLPDESEIAAATAALHPNIDHHVCRSSPAAVRQMFGRIHRHHFGPMLNTGNAEWYIHTLEAAKAKGAAILLTGGMGNFSISRGGAGAIADVLRENGVLAWWKLSRALTRGEQSWRSIANSTAGPWMPRQLHRAIVSAMGRSRNADVTLPLLRSAFRAEGERLAAEGLRDQRPSPDLRTRVRDYLYETDNADLTGIASWGVEQRDPTSDRRLVEFCHSLAARHLASSDTPRPAYAAAFADRVPPAVIEGARRGFQAADWLEVYRPEAIREALASYAANPLIGDLFDLDEAGRMLDCWPRHSGYEADILQVYGQHLLNTVALAGFIAQHFD